MKKKSFFISLGLSTALFSMLLPANNTQIRKEERLIQETKITKKEKVSYKLTPKQKEMEQIIEQQFSWQFAFRIGN